jgi:hypothetical protein
MLASRTGASVLACIHLVHFWKDKNACAPVQPRAACSIHRVSPECPAAWQPSAPAACVSQFRAEVTSSLWCKASMTLMLLGRTCCTHPGANLHNDWPTRMTLHLNGSRGEPELCASSEGLGCNVTRLQSDRSLHSSQALCELPANEQNFFHTRKILPPEATSHCAGAASLQAQLSEFPAGPAT